MPSMGMNVHFCLMVMLSVTAVLALVSYPFIGAGSAHVRLGRVNVTVLGQQNYPFA